jgi:hypothetical protein
MRLTIIAALLFALIGLNGCPQAPEPIAPPVTSEQLAQMRQDFRREDREARVGLVTDVLASDNLASVGSLTPHDLQDFTLGDIITFIDSNGKVLTLGHVEAINRDSLTVRYSNSGSHGRAPVPGDAAVRAIH